MSDATNPPYSSYSSDDEDESPWGAPAGDERDESPWAHRASDEERDPNESPWGLATIGALVATGISVLGVVFLDPLVFGGVLIAVAGLYVFHRVVLSWTAMLFVLVGVVLFIPIRRYALPIPVGFALEPYRVVIAGLLVALILAFFLRDTRERKPVVWGWPIAIFLWTMLASLLFNVTPLVESGLFGPGFGNLFQLSFLLSVVFVTRQLLSTERITMIVLNVIVLGGAFIGFFAFLERFTRENIFLLLGNFLPLQLLRDDAESLRAGGNRAFGSAQHPIALAVLFCMIIPLAVYLMKYSPWPRFEQTRRILYIGAIGIMLVGMLAAVSRTGVVTLGAMFLFVLVMRPKLGGILAAIGAPIALVVGLVLPQLFESMVLSLLDIDSLVASQYASVGMAGQGRLADLPGAFDEFSQAPLAGTGLGSRIVVGENANAQILDNQWLGTLLETGVVGIIGLIALLVWPIITMVRFMFRSDVDPKWTNLVFAIATASVGYTAAMFFYDAFAFMQTLLLLAILYAIAAWAMTGAGAPPEIVPTRRGRRRRRRRAAERRAAFLASRRGPKAGAEDSAKAGVASASGSGDAGGANGPDASSPSPTDAVSPKAMGAEGSPA
ncbi:O-antigen ligase family protein [Agromyces protaetiae]|uniref:O-antigen ligase family protein n=1 Tax=Agromyces protaetiae TaxID=2509455 RepID=A0A4P6FFG0_9MICO|nr:O-antigen ligase family protein [Agromyces protaetiae]QAY74685.1 O-antigen ligase family protein [Agromyces protaetiae]